MPDGCFVAMPLGGGPLPGYLIGATGMEVSMRILFALCCASSVALCPSGVMGQIAGGHDEFHYWYKGLKSPEGDSCCNEKDCHPVDSRYATVDGARTLEISIRGRWVKVPKDRILPQPSPDGGVHACYSDPAPYMTEANPGLVIRCVIIGGLT
jgi:hypothetical protein